MFPHQREGYTPDKRRKPVINVVKCWHNIYQEDFTAINNWYMDKEKFYTTVYKLIEDYFCSFSKKPHYLMVNSQFDLTQYVDQDDLKQDRFKGMTIVRTPDISTDKVIVY